MTKELEDFYADLAASQESPPEIPITVNDILAERGSRYGSFEDQAALSQQLQQVFYSHMMQHQTTHVPPFMIESLNMIFHKLARIANGDPFYDDSWTDISGYSRLVVNILKTNSKEPA